MSAYQMRWGHGFVRAYDMGDSNIHVIRHIDLADKTHVLPGTVSFEIDLPDRVSGDINPVTDVFALARTFLS